MPKSTRKGTKDSKGKDGKKDNKGREEQKDKKIQDIADKNDPESLGWAKYFVGLVNVL